MAFSLSNPMRRSSRAIPGPWSLLAWVLVTLSICQGCITYASPPAALEDAVGPQLVQADLEAWLDGFMPYALSQGDVAGAVVVVVRDGQPLLEKGYGYANVKRRIPVDARTTLFRVGSLSKLFTWTMVLQLVEQGRLDLDRDINAYLDFGIPPAFGRPVTLRNLMTHSAGFEDVLKGLVFLRPEDARPLGSLLRQYVPRRIFAPGTIPAYSNYGTALAAYIVERVSEQRFEDGVDARIFAPLGMRISSFRQPLPLTLMRSLSQGYALGSGAPHAFELIAHAPAGSLATTGDDMAKFMIAHLDSGGPLIAPATARLMHRTMMPLAPPLDAMALGFYARDINGRTVIGHGGDTQWFHSALWLFPNERTGLFIAMNSTGRAGAHRSIRSALFEQFADRYFPAPRNGTSAVASILEMPVRIAHARSMAGSYISSRRPESGYLKALTLFSQIRVETDGKGHLVTGALPGLVEKRRIWAETGPYLWQEIGGRQRLAARPGTPLRFSYDAISPIAALERVPWYRASAWVFPLLLASVAILAASALAMPVRAAPRWRFGLSTDIEADEQRVRLMVAILSLAAVFIAAGWSQVLTAMTGDLANLAGGFDTAIGALQVAGSLSLAGLIAAAARNLWLLHEKRRGPVAVSCAGAILLAAGYLLWTALLFNLLPVDAPL